MKLSVAAIIPLLALGPAMLSAQGRQTQRPKPDSTREIPASERPPAGMCRIWLDGVPAAQQPAVTDCASAVRNRPAKGRVIFGDDYVKSKKKKAVPPKLGLPLKGFAPRKGSTTRPDTSVVRTWPPADR